MRFSEKLTEQAALSTLHCNNGGGPVEQHCCIYGCNIAIKHITALFPEDRIRMGEKALSPLHLLLEIQDDTIDTA